MVIEARELASIHDPGNGRWLAQLVASLSTATGSTASGGQVR